MSKISNTQVIMNVRTGINEADKQTLQDAMGEIAPMYEADKAHVNRERRWVCHAILDCLHKIQDEEIKSGLRQLVKKYLSGAGLRDGEYQEYKELIGVLGLNVEGDAE